jgi:hypothetical protein
MGKPPPVARGDREGHEAEHGRDGRMHDHDGYGRAADGGRGVAYNDSLRTRGAEVRGLRRARRRPSFIAIGLVHPPRSYARRSGVMLTLGTARAHSIAMCASFYASLPSGVVSGAGLALVLLVGAGCASTSPPR